MLFRMMTSSPPNNSSNFKNANLNLNLMSSPSFNENLNLQLDNIDALNFPSNDDSNHEFNNNDTHFTTTTGASSSNSTSNLNYHQQGSSHQQNISVDIDNVDNYDDDIRHDDSDRRIIQNMHSTPQYDNHNYPNLSSHNDQEFQDFVPISSNSDPNLQYPPINLIHNVIPIPESLSNSTISTLASGNNIHPFTPSLSTNSISSNLHQTPLQNVRRSSVNNNNNMTNFPVTTPIQTPIKRSSVLVTPRRLTVGSNSSNNHRRSKSKIAIDKSPANGNPFYNPPSFLSPKIRKHKKTTSISTSISLSHLDEDLQLQQFHSQISNSGSPMTTPLRTPGLRKSAYNNDDDDEGHDDDDDDDDDERDKVAEGNNDGEDDDNDDDDDDNDAVDIDDSDDSDDVHHHLNKHRNINETVNDENVNESTFISPSMLMKQNKFGGKLPDIHQQQHHQNSQHQQHHQNSQHQQHQQQQQKQEQRQHQFQRQHQQQRQQQRQQQLQQQNQQQNQQLQQQQHQQHQQQHQQQRNIDEQLENANSKENAALSLSLGEAMNYPNNFINPEFLNNSQDIMFMIDSDNVETFGQDVFSFHGSDKQQHSQQHQQPTEHQQQQHQNQRSQSLQEHESEHLSGEQNYQNRDVENQSPHSLIANSIPQTSPSQVSGRLTRSRSTFNLSDIASSKEAKNAAALKTSPDYSESGYAVNVVPEQIINYNEMSEQQFQNPNFGNSVPYTIPSGLYNMPHFLTPPSSSSAPPNFPGQVESHSGATNISSSASSIITTKPKTRSRKSTLSLSDLKHPEKLDLPQQSARSKSRSKKTDNEKKKIHECPLCHSMFQRPEHVKRHMRSHSSEKPFVCPEENCGKRFNRNDNLKQHLRKIHGLQP